MPSGNSSSCSRRGCSTARFMPSPASGTRSSARASQTPATRCRRAAATPCQTPALRLSAVYRSSRSHAFKEQMRESVFPSMPRSRRDADHAPCRARVQRHRPERMHSDRMHRPGRRSDRCGEPNARDRCGHGARRVHAKRDLHRRDRYVPGLVSRFHARQSDRACLDRHSVDGAHRAAGLSADAAEWS